MVQVITALAGLATISTAIVFFLDRVRKQRAASARIPSNRTAAARNANPALDPITKEPAPHAACRGSSAPVQGVDPRRERPAAARHLLSQFFEAEQLASQNH